MSNTLRRPRRSSPHTPNLRRRISLSRPDYLDAEAYGFGTDKDLACGESGAPLSWRLDPSKSLSDWTIVVTKPNDASSPPAIYHVHRTMLAVGPKRSEYFSALFQNLNDVAELANSTSRIALENGAAAAFPAMLDYLYSTGGGDIAGFAATGIAVALRHLAQYFRIRSLFVDISKFVRNDLRPKTALTYLSEATIYGDEKLAIAAQDLCAENLERIDKIRIAVLSPELIKNIFTSKKLKCGSEILSTIVAAVCEAQKGRVEKGLFQIMTDTKIMPTFDPSISHVLLETHMALERTGVEDANGLINDNDIKKRCGRALWSSWQESAGESHDTTQGFHPRGAMAGKCREFTKSLQIELLEASLHAAKADIDSKNAEVKKLKGEVKNLNEQKFAVVHGAGAHAVNGVYTRNGCCDTVDIYKRTTQWNGEPTTFSLFRCELADGTRRWYISIVPKNMRPGSHRDDDFYLALMDNDDFNVPPTDGWKTVKGGADPAPVVMVNAERFPLTF